MSATAFISYSHLDERVLGRLHKHLAMLQREGLISIWHDRRIAPGDKIDGKIDAAFGQSDLFLPLVSADFLASPYCYDREMKAAVARSNQGSMRIVPIIAEPCDWLASPLAVFKALPTDGKAISLFANENVALLDVTSGLRELLSEAEPPIRPSDEAITTPTSTRRMRIKREFDVIDRAEFRDAAFETICSLFERSARELNQVGDPLKARYERIGSTAFTCTIVNRARQRGEAHITVHNHKSRSMGDITYTNSAHAPEGTANGIINVDADEYQLFLRLNSFGFGHSDKEKFNAEEVARDLWNDLMKDAGIEYE
ncbi:MAG TPA: toll/interleukin-1 receptor domain-containing protein [Bauldia sp.]|nr:toll/interleukin-1 receptor domain-containing protein [Bauldia sp.]